MAKIDYVFVIQRRTQPAIMRILTVDPTNEAAHVQDICAQLKKEHDSIDVQYARHPDDDTVVLMKQVVV